MRLTDDGGSPAGPGRGCRNDLLLEHAWRVAPRASREAVFHLSSGNGHPAGMSEAGAPRKACPGTHGLHGGPLLLVGLDPAVVAASLHKAVQGMAGFTLQYASVTKPRQNEQTVSECSSESPSTAGIGACTSRIGSPSEMHSHELDVPVCIGANLVRNPTEAESDFSSQESLVEKTSLETCIF